MFLEHLGCLRSYKRYCFRVMAFLNKGSVYIKWQLRIKNNRVLFSLRVQEL